MNKCLMTVALCLGIANGRSVLAVEEPRPFGIVFGQPLRQEIIEKQLNQHAFMLKSVPSPYPGITAYGARVDPDGKVCSVVGYIPSSDLDAVDSQIGRIYLYLHKEYGVPKTPRGLGGNWFWQLPDRMQTVWLTRYQRSSSAGSGELSYTRVGSKCFVEDR